MNPWLLDLVLILVLFAHAVHGYRRGFLLTVTEAVGFLAGAALALFLLPSRVETLVPERFAVLRPLFVVAGVLVLAALGQLLVVRLARPFLGGRRPGAARHLDRVLGGLVTAVVATVVVWFVASLLKTVAPAWIRTPIEQSQVLQAVGRVMPETSDRLLTRVITTLDDYGFPRAFSGRGQETINPVDAGDASLVASPAVAAARRSVLRVDASALRCGRDRAFEGTGWVAADDRIVTSAHVVAGAENVTVQTSKGPRRATVIAFDPRRDLAVLSVPGLDAPPLRRGADLRAGVSAVVAGYPLNGPYRLDPARVRGVVSARGLDIYSAAPVERKIYSLRTTIYPGNSGGPLLDAQGAVVGVVFARSVQDATTGYALTLEELAPVLRGASVGQPVGTGGQCAAA